MLQYEKGLCSLVFGLVALLVWQVLKTVFYRLPCAVCRLVTKHH